MLRRSHIHTSDLVASGALPKLVGSEPHILSRVDIDGQSLPWHFLPLVFLAAPTGIYHSHLVRQQADVKCFMADEELVLDGDMDYEKVVGLSSEIRERLFTVRPSTIVRRIPILFPIHSTQYMIGCSEEDGGYDPHVLGVSYSLCQADAPKLRDALKPSFKSITVTLNLLQALRTRLEYHGWGWCASCAGAAADISANLRPTADRKLKENTPENSFLEGVFLHSSRNRILLGHR